MKVARRFAPVLLLCACGCFAEPQLEYADWLLEIPEGAEVIEYAPVPIADRDPDAIRLVEDLVIGADLTDPAKGVFRPAHVVASPAGDIFVADSSEDHIQMFRHDGEFVRTLGRHGQGPGEFQNIWQMTIAGESLVVDDSSNNRFSVYTLDGEHVADHLQASRQRRRSTGGLDNGTSVSVRTTGFFGDDQLLVVARSGIDGEDLSRLAEAPAGPGIIPQSDWDSARMVRALLEVYAYSRFQVAVGAQQFVYLSPVHEYQVQAFSMSGEPLWALRVAGPRPSFSDAVKQGMIDQVSREDEPAARMEDIEWPEEYAAIYRLQADGHGRLYVFLEAGQWGTELTGPVPVDVYSSAGERVAAGYLSAVWSYAQGEYVYGIRTDPETEERVAVRYRLIVSEH